jgi:hypothetical protein
MIVDTPYCSAYLSINAIHSIHSSFTVVGSWGDILPRNEAGWPCPIPAFGYRYLFSGLILHQEIPDLLTPKTSM